MNLLLSTLVLVAGPFVYAIGQKQPNARQVLDGIIFITIAGIVCVHIVPDAIEIGGPLALVFLLLGLAFPTLIERQFERSLREAHVFVLILAALCLALHAAIDGIALLPLGQDALAGGRGVLGDLSDNQLALGVILHRLPVGMAIWWSLRPAFGAPVAMSIFALVIAATAGAYFFGAEVVALAETKSVVYFQAFVAGSLVHVVAFGVTHDHAGHLAAKPPAANWAYRVGILLGMFLVFTMPHIR